MRAPGSIASIPAHDEILERIAESLSLCPDAVREANMYQLGDVTPPVCGGIKLGAAGFDWRIPEMWADAKAEWRVAQRRTSIAAFNAANRWRKRGLCLLPVKYGIPLWWATEPATVRIFASDGSVIVTHGGCEIGQGIHTKAAQTASYGLDCPLEKIAIGDTSADRDLSPRGI